MKRRVLLVVVFLGLATCSLAGQLRERLYRQACDGGSMLECNLLGIMYETGDGVAQDLGRAAAFYQKACDGEIMETCAHLGVMYANGTGVTQDFSRAITLLQRACDGGETQACSQLDVLFQLMTTAVLQQLPVDDRVLTIGVEASGRLSDADPEVMAGQYTQAWALTLGAGQEVTVVAASSDFDAYLRVMGPGLDSGLSDDDSGGGCDARITFTAPEGGLYRAIVNSANPSETGEFVLRASDAPPAVASGTCSRAVASVAEPLPPALQVQMHIAVLEHVLESDVIRAGEPVTAICVGVGGTGEQLASSDILSSLSGHEPPVVTSTDCTRSLDAATSLPKIQTSDGGPGIFLTVVEAPVGREADGSITGVVVLRVERDGVAPRTLRCSVEVDMGAAVGVQRRATGGRGGGGSRGGGQPPSSGRDPNLSVLCWPMSGC